MVSVNQVKHMQLQQLKRIKEENDAKQARVESLAFRKKLIQHQDRHNYRNEYDKIRFHLEGKNVANTTTQLLAKRQAELEKLYNF
jgi:hypothetical protein